MSRLFRSGLGLVFSVALLALGGIAMTRRDLPQDVEFRYGGGRIAVRSASLASNRSYDIAVIDGTGKTRSAVMTGDEQSVSIDNIQAGNTYIFHISRKDILGRIRYRPSYYQVVASVKPYVVLVGASIGKAWMFPGLPRSYERNDVDFGYRFGTSGFDKEDIITNLLFLEQAPTAVIIKECAAYFPRDTQESMRSIEKWVRMLERGGVRPILMTTVPVTPTDDRSNSGRQASINSFNDALRDFAEKNGIVVFDAQKILDDGSADRYLREQYAAADGLHLNRGAYKDALDQAAIRAISAVLND